MDKAEILIVDDTPENLHLLHRMLTARGYAVRTALDGPLALKTIHTFPPDLILLDVMLPEMDGYEICRRLKADAATRDIPIIFLTARTGAEEKLKGFTAGGNDYLTKPFQLEEVLARVNVHLLNWQLRRQLQEEKEHFQTLAEATFEGILIHADGIIILANQTLATLMGYQSAELVGMPALDLLTPDSQAEVFERLRADAGQPYETHARKRDGTILPVEIQARPLTWQGRAVRMAAIRDITWRKALEQKTHQLETENRTLRGALVERDHLGELVGGSPAMQKVYARLLQAAASDEVAILYGETGTGKELAAREIFAHSIGHTARLVTVNCAALPETLFEAQLFGYRKGAFTGAERDTPGYFDQAQGGTLFLDEIGELTIPMQAKLLRVLNDHTYTPVGATTSRTADVRLIAATNQELRKRVQEGQIREDFFQRIHVLALELPPLRMRKTDLPQLIAHFLTQQTPPGEPLPLIPAAIRAQFDAYHWPGNIRELFNELRRYLATGEIELAGPPAAAAAQLPGRSAVQTDQTLTASVASVEQQMIAAALAETSGNKTKAARLLGMPLITLQRKIKKYGL